MNKDIENIIKKNLPEKKVETWTENCCPRVDNEAISFNQAISKINTYLIADEVLKVVVEKIESIKRFRCGACDGARCSHCQACEMRKDIINLINN